MNDKLRAALVSAQWWLTVIVTISTGALIYIVAIEKPTKIGDGRALIPPAKCPGGAASDEKFSQAYKAREFAVIYYSDQAGCNQTTGTRAIQIGGSVGDARKRLLALGMRRPHEPMSVVLHVGAAPLVTSSRPNSRGAFAIDASLPESTVQFAVAAGVADLSLARSAPGLSGASRQRVSGAYAVLSQRDGSSLDAAARRLRSARSEAELDGLYDAWLVSRYGQGLLTDAVSRCRRPCSWPRTLAAEVRKRGGNPNRMLRQFSERATPGDKGLALRRRLLAR